MNEWEYGSQGYAAGQTSRVSSEAVGSDLAWEMLTRRADYPLGRASGARTQGRSRSGGVDVELRTSEMFHLC